MDWKRERGGRSRPSERLGTSAVPEKRVPVFCTGLDQAALNGSREARIVEIHGDVVRSGLARGFFPACADFVAGILGEDPVVGSLFAALALDRFEVHRRFDSECADGSGEAFARRLEVSDDSHVFVSFWLWRPPCAIS